MTIIPPKVKPNKETKERTFRTALDANLYLQLERESLERGTTPYRLAQGIITGYLTNSLVYVPELPDPIKHAITKFKNIPQTLQDSENLAGAEPDEPV